MKPTIFYLPGLEGKPEGLVLYGQSNFNLVTEGHSVIVLPGGNSSVMVPNQYIQPVFLTTRTTKADWYDVAKWIFSEGWNFEDDCPWSLSPIQTYIYTVDGQDKVFFYGHSRTQSKLFPEIRLGYLQNPDGNIVIVDSQLLEPEFMAQMGPDWQKWIDYSWAHIEQPTVGFNSQEWPLGATGHWPNLPVLD